VLTRLKADDTTEGIPVIALTVEAPPPGGPRPDGVVPKPFALADLLGQVERATGRLATPAGR
jgi:hypothetical protein